jgi:hypothetical protein
MRSSYTAFGYGSLKEDGEDVASLVGHLKGIGVEKIVLVGSSSGKMVHVQPSFLFP